MNKKFWKKEKKGKLFSGRQIFKNRHFKKGLFSAVAFWKIKEVPAECFKHVVPYI